MKRLAIIVLFLVLLVGFVSAINVMTGNSVASTSTSSCSENDKDFSLAIQGRNYDKFGITRMGTQSYADRCVSASVSASNCKNAKASASSNFLCEFYCSNNKLASTKVSSKGRICCNGALCKIGEKCSGGKCVSSRIIFQDKILFVFAYIDDPLPEDIRLKTIDYGNSKTSIAYSKIWSARQAAKYNVDFKPQFVIYPQQIKIPQEFLNPNYRTESSPAVVFSSDGEPRFEEWLENNYPDVKNYNYINVLIFGRSSANIMSTAIRGTKYLYLNLLTSRNPGESGEFFWLSEGPNPYIPFVFTHEFFHKLGATDKYTLFSPDCQLDEAGNEYQNDLFCASDVAFDNLGINSQTAYEIGWLKQDPYAYLESQRFSASFKDLRKDSVTLTTVNVLADGEFYVGQCSPNPLQGLRGQFMEDKNSFGILKLSPNTKYSCRMFLNRLDASKREVIQVLKSKEIIFTTPAS